MRWAVWLVKPAEKLQVHQFSKYLFKIKIPRFCHEPEHSGSRDASSDAVTVTESASSEFLFSRFALAWRSAQIISRQCPRHCALRHSQVPDEGEVDLQLSHIIVRKIHWCSGKSRLHFVHHIGGGWVMCKQRNHREQRLNFFADPAAPL
jgi:hypothetical protein